MCICTGKLELTLEEKKQLNGQFHYHISANGSGAAKQAWDEASATGRGPDKQLSDGTHK